MQRHESPSKASVVVGNRDQETLLAQNEGVLLPAQQWPTERTQVYCGSSSPALEAFNSITSVLP